MYWCPTSESERERGAKPGRHLLPLTWDPPSEAERKRGYSRLGVPLTDLDDAPGRGGGGGRPEEKRLQRVREDEMMPPRGKRVQGTDRRATAAVERLRAFGGDGQAR